MIASPGDVHRYRIAARDVILEWNSVHSVERSVVLVPVAWETHASPELGAQAQDLITNRVLEDCDLLIAIFWSRLGTRTSRADSGTVEEIQTHVAKGRPAMVYFCSAPIEQDADMKQFEQLKSFKRWCRENGLIWEFKDEYDFKHTLAQQLRIALRDNGHLKEIMATAGIQNAIAATAATVEEMTRRLADRNTPEARAERLTPPARELIVAAADPDHGTLLCTDTHDGGAGVAVKVGQRDFVGNSATRRDAARYKAAVQLLVTEGCLEPRGRGVIFEVTDLGFEVAAILKALE